MKNRDKEWKQIVQELLRAGREVAAWDYITALRGPDIPCKWPVKTVFTAPLRVRSMHQVVQNAADFERLSPKSIAEAFRFVCEYRDKLLHYLTHVESAWRALHGKVSFLLRGLMSFMPPEDLESQAREYKKLVDEWLDGTSVLYTRAPQMEFTPWRGDNGGQDD